MPRILLTTAPQPFELHGHDRNPLDLFSSRLTAGQGVFTFNHYSPPLGIHYIARNIQSPATVLEYPTIAGLKKELSRGYDVVGISFSNSARNNCMTACRLIREHSPGATIVLGGYGVQCLDQTLETDLPAEGLFDLICREEGVRFMRSYLGEPVDRPVSSDLPPQILYPFGAPFAAQPVGCIIIAFGCENRCPFCQTSAYYGHTQHMMMEPEEVAQQAKRYLRTYPGMKYIAFFCENYLGDKLYAEKVREYMEAEPYISPEHYSFEIMSSIKNISSYDPEELAALGIGSVWIGVESKFTSLDKRQGKSPAEIFPALHDAGIQTTGSFIIGLDEQSSRTIEEDVDYFVSLSPTMTQVAALVPGPGAALWDRIKAEGRLRLHDWKEQHAYAESMAYSHFKPGEVRSWVEETLRRLNATCGPGIFRSVRVGCRGYHRLRASKDRRLAARARFYKNLLRESRIVLPSIEKYAPSALIKQEANELSREVGDILGPLTTTEKIKQAFLGLWFLRNRLAGQGTPRRFSRTPSRGWYYRQPKHTFSRGTSDVHDRYVRGWNYPRAKGRTGNQHHDHHNGTDGIS